MALVVAAAAAASAPASVAAGASSSPLPAASDASIGCDASAATAAAATAAVASTIHPSAATAAAATAPPMHFAPADPAAAAAAPATWGYAAIVPFDLLGLESSIALFPCEPESTVGSQELRSQLQKGWQLQNDVASAPQLVPNFVHQHFASQVSMHLA